MPGLCIVYRLLATTPILPLVINFYPEINYYIVFNLGHVQSSVHK